MDEIKAARDQDRAQRAEELLRNEMLKEGFARLSQEYADAWMNTGVDDTAQRERLWQARRIVGLVEKHLKIAVDNGKLATKHLAQIKYLKR